MDFNKLARKAQQIYTERGGAKAAKGDASEVEEIFKGDGTLAEKAKRAAKALREPGAGSRRGPASDPTMPNQAEPSTSVNLTVARRKGAPPDRKVRSGGARFASNPP